MLVRCVGTKLRLTCTGSMLAIAVLSSNIALAAQAAEAVYPTRPVRVIVGFQPGGGSDLLARLVSPKLTERLGQSFVVDNRSGAGGGIAMETAANAAPDGYTLLVVSGSQVTNISLFTKLKVDVTKAFAPISQMTAEAYVLLAREGFQPGSIKELVAAAKAKPGTITCGSSGTGSFAHLGIELFNSLANVKITHVPYKGSGQALIDLLGGQIDMTIASSISAAPHMKAGKVRALAVTSARRTPLFPDLPTIAEAGVPGYDVSSWYGLVAPRATSEAIITRLNGDIVQIMALPDMKANLARSGADPAPSTPKEFGDRIAWEIAKWRKVVKETGLRLE
jgi:tripartite-type tricarboxylate transporter receptor subunit TctC